MAGVLSRVRFCQGCGAPLPPPKPGPGRARVWCSRKCNRANVGNNPGYAPRCSVAFVRCATCNKLFTARLSTARYCGERCRPVREAKSPERYSCELCGGLFGRPATRGQRPKYCSDCRGAHLETCPDCGRSRVTTRWGRPRCFECGMRRRSPNAVRKRLVHVGPSLPRCDIPAQHPARQGKKKARPRVWVGGSCRRCGIPFLVAAHPDARYCSHQCLRADGRDRRRAIKREAFVAEVWRARVFERDGWRCQLCGKLVARARRVPHPKAPVLDHILPLAAGGTHEPANVQCAHFLCNSRKGARAANDQLRLVG